MEVLIPERMMPTNKDDNDCACMSRAHLIKYKTGVIHWLADEQTRLEAGDDLCEVEIDKKIFTVTAPVSGVLTRKYVEETAEFSCQKPICCIETDE